MKINYRPLNSGESFYTSVKAAKAIFKNTEIKLCFGAYGRQYCPYKNEFGYGYYKKNIHGTVVATTFLHPGVKYTLLNFYVVKSESISSTLRDIFENDILHKLYDLYSQICLDCSSPRSTMIFVELLNGKFYIHQFVS